MEMIYGVACLDRADPLDGQESRREQALAKAETQDTPESSSAELGLPGPQPASLLPPPEPKSLRFHRGKARLSQ